MAAVVNDAVNNITSRPFTETEVKWLSGVRGVAGSVCLVLILLILLFICIQPAYTKNFRLRILLFLIVSTFFHLIFFTMQSSVIWKNQISSYTILCEVIAFFILYFGWQELLLVSSITVYLYFYFELFHLRHGMWRDSLLLF